MVLVAARLRDDVDDATFRLTILGLETACLYLDFFNEGGIDAGAQSAVGARKGAETAESGVGNVDPVSDVEIIES